MNNKRFWILNKKKKEKLKLHTKEDIFNILDYECKRTDRNNNIFSLIIFKINNNKKITNGFIKFLLNRKRIIDEIGWFNKNSIGMVLPGTDNENAKIIGEKIKINNNFKKLELSVFYYSYPDNWISKNEN